VRGEFLILQHFCDFVSLYDCLRCAMWAGLIVDLLASVARLTAHLSARDAGRNGQATAANQ
jgi:hypothetical protein